MISTPNNYYSAQFRPQGLPQNFPQGSPSAVYPGQRTQVNSLLPQNAGSASLPKPLNLSQSQVNATTVSQVQQQQTIVSGCGMLIRKKAYKQHKFEQPLKVVELRQYQEKWSKRIGELEHALKTMKPEERIVEKEKIVYYEDEERINDLNEKISELEGEIQNLEKQALLDKEEFSQKELNLEDQVHKLEAIRSELLSQKKNLENDLENSRGDCDQLSSQLNQKHKEVQQREKQIQELGDKIANLQRQLQDLNKNLDQVQDELEQTRDDLDAANKDNQQKADDVRFSGEGNGADPRFGEQELGVGAGFIGERSDDRRFGEGVGEDEEGVKGPGERVGIEEQLESGFVGEGEPIGFGFAGNGAGAKQGGECGGVGIDSTRSEKSKLSEQLQQSKKDLMAKDKQLSEKDIDYSELQGEMNKLKSQGQQSEQKQQSIVTELNTWKNKYIELNRQFNEMSEEHTMNKAELDQMKREGGKSRESTAKSGSTRQSQPSRNTTTTLPAPPRNVSPTQLMKQSMTMEEIQKLEAALSKRA